MRLFHIKAQSISEYVILLALVVSVFLAMQTYVKRGMQGRLRQSSDIVVGEMNRQLNERNANQYEPYYSSYSHNTDQTSTTQDTAFVGGRTRKEYNGGETIYTGVDTVTGKIE